MRTRHILAAFVPVTSWLADKEALHWRDTGRSYREGTHEGYIEAAESMAYHGLDSREILVLGERDKWGEVCIKYSGTAHKDWEAVNLDHIQIALYLDSLDSSIPVTDGIEEPEVCRAVWRCMTHINMTPEELRATVLATMFKLEALGVYRGDWTYDCLKATMEKKVEKKGERI